MYLLGLCYRNGYGLEANSDSARYWLEKAASYGYRPAGEEMQNAEPELAPATQGGNVLRQTDKKKNSGAKQLSFSQVRHYAPSNDLAGSYTGSIVRYDWSGKKIIGQSDLDLTLKLEGKQLTGVWKEGEGTSTSLQALLTDTGIVFSNTTYFRTDHYSPHQPVLFSFRQARLQVIKQGDSVYLSGNIQLWSPQRNEPEKPISVSLHRIQGAKEELSPINDSLKITPPPLDCQRRRVRVNRKTRPRKSSW